MSAPHWKKTTNWNQVKKSSYLHMLQTAVAAVLQSIWETQVNSCLEDYRFMIFHSPPAQSELRVKTNSYTRARAVGSMHVCTQTHVSPEVVDWIEVRMVWAQTGCPTLPSVGRLVKKKINKDTPYNSDVTHHPCPSSSAHVKMIPLGKWHWLDPLCWFTCDPHWCTRFCASCLSNGSGTGTETVVHASHSFPCLKTSMCMHTVMQGNCSAAKL